MANDERSPEAESPPPPTEGSPGRDAQGSDKAADSAPVTPKTCVGCKLVIASEYFEVGDQALCRPCRDQLVGATPDRWAFFRALLFGGLVGVAGTVVWSLIIHLTGYELGLIAILVGVGVGIAVRKGSRGRGGWKYQTLAMVLTYVSITTSYVPIILKGMFDGDKGKTAIMEFGAQKPATEPPKPSEQANPGNGVDEGKPDPAQSSLPLPIALLAFAALVWGLALAAPFLAGASNFMGIIIIAIGLYEAWKYNRRVIVTGPIKLAAASPAEPAGTSVP